MISRFMDNPKSDWRFLKEVNETRLLDLIRKENENGISRVELSRQAEMSKTAVSEIISRLLASGFIKEEGKGESTARGGKRPTQLFINPDGGFVFGIHIRRSSVSIMLADILGHEIDIEKIKYRQNPSLDETLDMLISAIDDMIVRRHLEKNKLVGMGIAVPGLVDIKTGRLIMAETLNGWANKPFAQRLTDHYDAPAVVGNDINIQTWGEFLLGAGNDRSDMILVNIGDGIGAGIIENGTLVRGILGGAGEIGYISLRPYLEILKDNILVRNGENYIGQLFTKNNILESFKESYRRMGHKFPVKEDIDHLEVLFSLADKGDEAAKKVAFDMARLLGIVCSNLIIILNSSMLAVSGSMIEGSSFFIDSLKDEVMEFISAIPLQKSTEIVPGQLNDKAALTGAVSFALDIIYKPFMNK